jgi:hypothetical protein
MLGLSERIQKCSRIAKTSRRLSRVKKNNFDK